jgi:hypothetical protein
MGRHALCDGAKLHPEGPGDFFFFHANLPDYCLSSSTGWETCATFFLEQLCLKGPRVW